MHLCLVNRLNNDCFGKFTIVFTCSVSESISTAYIPSYCGDVSFFERERIFLFCGIYTVAFHVSSSGGVFRLRVSGKTKVFTCCPNDM